MSIYLTSTRWGLENITHIWVEQNGTKVLKMLRVNGQEITFEDLR